MHPCRIVDNSLVVMWQVGSNAASLLLLVFDLTDPLAPTLVANVSQNRRFINSLFFKGRIAFAGMSTVTSSLLGNLRGQFGDFVSFDLSDFANPRLLDAIFKPENPPDGGDFIVSQGTAVNDSLAFVATTTSTGVALPGVGRLLTVDIAQPSNLPIVNELQMPGTGHLTGIATQGNLALAVSNQRKSSAAVILTPSCGSGL